MKLFVSGQFRIVILCLLDHFTNKLHINNVILVKIIKKKSLINQYYYFFTLLSLYIPAQDAPPPDGVFRIQNVAIGKYLRDVDSSVTAVTISGSGEETYSHWSLLKVVPILI